MSWLDLDQLVRELSTHREKIFRMETLPAYAVTSDGDDFRRWVAGEPEPTWARKQPWLDALRAEHDAGKLRYRVRILSEQLTEYERYACEWGYALNAKAGEDIRVLRRGEHQIPPDLIERDFWVVDDDRMVAMHYAKDGRFEGGEVLPDAALAEHLATRDRAWAAAEPFLEWWERHPELHRPVAV